MYKIITAVSLLLLSPATFSKTYSFNTNKIYLDHFYENVYKDGKFIYSECSINGKTCDLEYNGEKVDKRMSWEHVVPSDRMSDYNNCGLLKRDECSSINMKFKLCYNNIHNLYPSIFKVNIIRSNRDMDISTYKKIKPFNRNIYLGSGTFTPPYKSMGKIARTYLYMQSIDCIHLSREELYKYNNWNMVPVSKEEISRNAYIYLKTGTYNKFIYRGLIF